MQQTINVHESTKEGSDTKTMSAFAKSIIGQFEPYQTTELDIQDQPGSFETTFKPSTTTASQTFTQSESIMVSETNPDVGLSTVEQEIIQKTQAKFSFLLKEAAGVEETETSQTEIEFTRSAPKTVSADKSFVSQEGLEIVEINEGEIEKSFKGDFKPVPQRPNVTVPPSESIMIEEIETATHPEEYKPEEALKDQAKTSVIEQKQITTSEMIIPELEGEFRPGKLPPSQTANLDITAKHSFEVHEQQIHEREKSFTQQSELFLNADQTVIPLEGVSVTQVETQMPQKELEIQEVEKEKAGVNVIPQESIVSTVTHIEEREGKYIPGQLPEGKTVSTSITCLETPENFAATVQEAESELKEEKPLLAYAAPDVRPEESISVSEVQLAEVPNEFKDKFKYTTDAAETSIVTQKSKQITETFIQEMEAKIDVAQIPQPSTVQKSFEKQQEIQVLETHLVEKEGTFKPLELPETHKTKTVPTHVLQTGITEETHPEVVTGQFKEIQTLSDVAKVKHDVFEEMVIEEAIPSDYFKNLSREDTPKVKADMRIPEGESLAITEVIIQDKENIYQAKELPEQFYAKPDISGQKVAIKTEVHPETFAEQLSIEQPTTKQALPEQLTLESVLVTHSQIAEKEGVFVKEFSPEKHKAAVEINEGVQGISITEVVFNDRENVYLTEDKPKERCATPNIASQNVVVKSEVIPADNINEFKEKLPTVKARKWAQPFDELIVMQHEFDVGKNLPKDIWPDKKNVKVLLDEGHEVAISEVIIHEKEGKYTGKEQPEYRQANVDVIEKNIALKQEVIPDNMLDKFDRVSPTKDSAVPVHDTMKYITQSTHTVVEKEAEYKPEVKPDEKTASVALIEEEGVTITMVQTEDRERKLSEGEKPTELTADTKFDGQNVAIISEVSHNVALDKMSEETPLTAAAKTKPIPFESMITIEAHAHEKEGVYTGDIKPDTQTALPDLELGESVTITAVTAGHKENVLPSFEKPEEFKADSSISGHVVAEKIEVTPENITHKLDRESPVKSVATSDHVLFETTLHTETSTAEKEGIFKEIFKPETKSADVTFDEVSSTIITEVIVNNKESDYKPQEWEEKFAIPDMTGMQKIAEKSEIVPQVGLGKFVEQQPDKFQATPDQQPFEGIIQTEVLVKEKESEFRKDFKVDKFNAKSLFEENRSVTIMEVASAERESAYNALQKPEERTAKPDITGHEIAHKMEIVSNESISKFEEEKVKKAEAKPKQDTFESLVSTETTFAETESMLDTKAKPATKSVDVSLEHLEGITVTSVVPTEVETALSIAEMPETKSASTDIIGHSIATTGEVESALSLGKLEIDKEKIASAKMDHVPHEVITRSEISSMEQEDVMPAALLPETQRAKFDVITGQSVIVSQITVGDLESTLAPEKIPEEKVAKSDLGHEGHEVAQQSQNVMVESFTEFKEKAPKESQATEDLESGLSGIIISENYIQESEKQFEGKFEPKLMTPNIGIEKGKKVQVVTEIVLEDREDLVDKSVVVDKTATLSISGHEIAEKSEVLPHMTTGDWQPSELSKKSAAVSHIPHEYLVQTEPTVQETESSIDTALKYVSKSANLLLEQNQSMSVMEVRSQEKEAEFATPEKPIEGTAEPSFTGKEVAQHSIVVPENTIGDLSIDKPTKVSAKTEQSTFEGIIQMQTETGEKEDIFTSKFVPSTKTVDVNFEEGRSVLITEILATDKEQHYEVPEITESKQASTGYTTKEVAQLYEVEAHDSFGDYSKEAIDTKRAIVAQNPFEALIQAQPYVADRETEFTHKMTLDIKTAETVLEKSKSVNVSQVIPHDHEELLQPEEMAEKKAQPNVVSQESIQQTSVVPQMTVKHFDDKVVLDTKQAETALEFGKSINVTQVVHQEQESTLVAETAAEKTATTEILTREVPEQTIIQAQDTSKTFEDKIVLDTKNAESVLELGKSVNITQVIHGEQEVSFEAEDIVEKKAQPEIMSQEPIEQMIVQPGMTAKQFEDKIVFDTKLAETALELGKSVNVTQIIHQEQESEFKPEELVGKKAQPDFVGQEAIEQTVVQAHMTAKEFADKIILDTKTAEKTLDTGKSLTVTQVVCEEQECELKVDDVTTKQAQTEIISQESIQQTVVQPEITARDFEGKVEFDTKVAETALELGKSINITQVVHQEAETKLEAEKPAEKVAQPEILSQEPLEQTVVQPEMTVKHFDDKVVFDTKKAETALEIGKSVNITQVVHEEHEGEFKPEELVGKTAQPQILSQEPIEQTVIQPQMTVKHFDDKIVFDTKTAETALTLGKSLNITQIVHQEQEEIFKPEEIAGKTATTEFLGQEALEQTVVQPHVTAKHFEGQIVFDTKTAESQLELERSVNITQVVHEEQEEVFKPEEITEKKAQPEILSQEPIEQTITQPLMTVKQFGDKIILDTKTAETILELAKSLSVTQVIHEEQESDLAPHELEGKKAQSEIMELQALEQLIIQCQITAKQFEDKIVLDTKTAEAILELGKSLNIIQVVHEEQEGPFTAETFEGKVAQTDILSQEPLEQTVVQPHMTVKEFTDKIVFDTKTAETALELGKSVNVSQVVHHEQEGDFKPQEFESKVAQTEILSQESIQQSSVQEYQDVRHFEDKIVLDTKQAESILELGKSVNISQIVTQEKEEEFKPDDVVAKTAEPSILSQETIEQTIVQPGITARHFADKVTFDLKTAQQALELGKSVNVTQIIPQELEDTYSVEDATPKTAETKILSQEPIEQSIVQSQMTAKHFDDKVVFDTKTAETTLELGKSVSVTQVISQEQEEEFRADEIVGKTAQSEIPLQEPLEQSMVETHMNVQQFEDKIVFDTKTAESVLELGKSVSITQVISQEREDEFKPDELNVKTIQPQIPVQEPVLQSVVESHMNIEEFKDKIIFDTRKAEAALELGKSVTITQVISHEQGDELQPESFAPKTAQTQINLQEPVQQSIVQSHMNVQQFEDKIVFDTKTAEQVLDLGKHVNIEQVLIQEQEDIFQPEKVTSMVAKSEILSQEPIQQSIIESHQNIQEFSDKVIFDTKQAESVLELGKSISVTQVVLEEQGKEFQADIVTEKNAEAEILSQESVQQTTVQTQFFLEQFKDKSPEKITAQLKQDQLEGVIISESMVQETEKPFESIQDIAETKVKIGVTGIKTVSITETVPQEMEGVLPKEVEAPKLIAKSEISGQEVAQKTEITTETTVEKLKTEVPSPEKGEITQTLLETISISEAETVEKEGKFDKDFRPTTDKASIVLDEQKSVSIMQIVSEDKEKVYEVPLKPQTQKADTEIISMPGVESSEVVPLDTLKKLPDGAKVEPRSAEKTQVPLEGIIHTQISASEKEEILKTSPIPDTVSAEMNLQLEREITTTEVVAQEQETEKVVPGFAEEIAKPEVIQRQVAVKTETVTEDTLAEFEAAKVEEKKLKSSLLPQQHSLIITETESAGETESVLPDKIIPSTRTASQSLEQRDTNLQVTEVVVHDREGEFISFICRSILNSFPKKPSTSTYYQYKLNKTKLYQKNFHDVFSKLVIDQSRTRVD